MVPEMSETLRLVVGLIQRGEVRPSAHGYDELAADGILAREVIDGVQAAAWSKTTRRTRRAAASLCGSSTPAGGRSTPCGESRKARHRQPC